MFTRFLLLWLLLPLGPVPKKAFDFGKHRSAYLTFPLPRRQKVFLPDTAKKVVKNKL